MFQVLSPLGYPAPESALPDANRLGSMDGARLALLDNRKLNSDKLLRAIGARIQAGQRDMQVRYWDKDKIGATGPATDEMVSELLRSSDAALVALGD